MSHHAPFILKEYDLAGIHHFLHIPFHEKFLKVAHIFGIPLN